MKKVTLNKNYSTSLSEGSLSKTPQLPSTTPSIGTNGRSNPYTTLLEPQLNTTTTNNNNNTNNLSLPTPPNSQMHVIYKMIAKLPFEVRESVTSIVNMALFNLDNTQKQYEGIRIELLTLKNQHKKKMTECDYLNQRCEIFREQISKLEEKLGALQDDAESRQTYAIRNSKAISRLSSTNKTLIDAFALLTDGPNTKTIVHRNSQRRKNNLVAELGSPQPRASSPDEYISSQPTSPALKKTKQLNQQKTHANSDLEVSVTKNEKLRERLLRVAKDHNRVVKNVENLESKIQGLRSSLRYAERRNRQLQLELDELRENQSLENSVTVKNPTDGDNNDRRGNSGSSKHIKDRMDTRLSVLVNRNAFDPMDGIKYMDSMIAHLSSTPCNLIEEEVARHLCSRNACNLFDAEKIAIFILQPGGSFMNRYVTNSTRIDKIKVGERESIAENVLRHGLIRRYNNLKQSKNLFFNPDIDSVGDSSLKRILSVPMREMGQGRVIGVFQLLNKRDSNKFSEVDELYATAYGEMCGGLVSGSILFRRIWNESSIISGIIQSPYHLLDAVPEKDTLCSTTPLNIIDILFTLEHVVRNSLKCSKTKAFVICDPSTQDIMYSLEQEAISMITLKSSQLSLKKSPKHSGVAGHVITSKKSYLVVQPSFDPWLNPEVDMHSPETPFYCVPIQNFKNEIIGCIQLSPSSLSPNISSTQDKIDPLVLSFEKAADWLAYTLSNNLSNILDFVGKPSSRPDIRLNSITLTEKLVSMPLSLTPTVVEPVRKRKPTLMKSVTMAEESSHLPGGGLYDNGLSHKPNRDEDLREFLLQFPDYEQNQHHTSSTSSSHNRHHNDSNTSTTTTTTNNNNNINNNNNNINNNNNPGISSVDILDTQRSSKASNQISPNHSQDNYNVEEIEKIKQKYDKEINGIKAELFFAKENSKQEKNKLLQELKELKEQQNNQKTQETQVIEQEYEHNLQEYKKQFENDISQLRAQSNQEKELFQKNIQHLEETIKVLQSKLAFVDRPIDNKNLDILGYLEVSKVQITYLNSQLIKSDSIIQLNLGDGNNWSFESNTSTLINSSILWKNLKFTGKISQAQIPVDTLSIRVKEKKNDNIKLTGVANINLSSLLSQTNVWVTLTGDLLQNDGLNTIQAKYSIRLKYRRDGQEPLPDDDIDNNDVNEKQIEKQQQQQDNSNGKTAIKQNLPSHHVGPKGYLDIFEITFKNLKINVHQNLFTECSITDEWLELTEIKNLTKDNLSNLSWNHLGITGLIYQKSIEDSTLSLILKQQHVPNDIVIGKTEIVIKNLLTKTYNWFDLEGDIFDQKNKVIGTYHIRLRYRLEGQEPPLFTKSQDKDKEKEKIKNKESEIINNSNVQHNRPHSSNSHQLEEVKKKNEESLLKQKLTEHIEVSSNQNNLMNDAFNIDNVNDKNDNINDDDNDDNKHKEQQEEEVNNELEEQEKVHDFPPPTPTKEEVARSPRIGYWAEMTDHDGNVYYYHTITGETSWDPPDELNQTDVPQDNLDDLIGANEYNGSSQMRNGDWIQLQDDGGNFYWYNEVTGESSWELPSEEPEHYALPETLSGGSYGSATAGGYTIEL